jgi:hypothetical protein
MDILLSLKKFSMKRCKCGSYAINRDNQSAESSLEHCDVCYWKKRYLESESRLEFLLNENQKSIKSQSCARDQGSTQFCYEALEQIKKADSLYSELSSIKKDLEVAIELLLESEQIGPTYVDINSRSKWKCKKEQLVSKHQN